MVKKPLPESDSGLGIAAFFVVVIFLLLIVMLIMIVTAIPPDKVFFGIGTS